MHNISQVTLDEFYKLTPADHSVAIHTYTQSMTQLEAKLARPGSEDAKDAILDEHRRCQQLRKVHVAALAEQLDLLPERVAVAA